VDFTFSPEQEALRDAVRTTLAAEAPRQYVRAMIDDQRGFTDELWVKLADLGWTGLLIPEESGGLGLGLIDLVVVEEEMGKLPFPGPYFSSSVAATLVALRLGAANLLPDLASGAKRGTVAVEEFGRGNPLDDLTTTATRASAAADEWVLDGVKPLVLDGATADWVIVVARDGDGLGSFLVEQPVAEPVPALDVTRKMARVVLDATPARRIGPPGDQTARLARALDDIALALCAETVGATEAALNMAVDYAQVRVQFDRPIASFQVIRHKTVDMLHRLELARVGTHWAAWTSDTDDVERERAAAMAKSFVAEAAVFVTAENIQIHGGVGFTWDVDAHLHYRRVKQNDLLFGNQGWQRRRLADLVLD
jgi:alkylation response protein AidB-like acyl-CoA dehydrogenase